MNIQEILCGIFQVDGIYGQNKIKLNYIKNESISQTKFITDSKIHASEIETRLYCEIYRCNITDKYIMSTKKLPIYNVFVKYYSKMVLSELIKLTLYFVIEDIVTTEEQLLSSELNGKYILEISIDNKTTVIDDDFGSFRGNKKTIKRLESIVTTKQFREILKNLMIQSDEKLIKKMGDPYSNLEIPQVTYSLR